MGRSNDSDRRGTCCSSVPSSRAPGSTAWSAVACAGTAGFNVVDLHGLHELLDRPVIVVARRPPRYAKIRQALAHVPGAAKVGAD